MMTDFYYNGASARHYSQIETLEALREEKKRIRVAMSHTSNRLKQRLGCALLPQNPTLLHSPMRMVRYSAYGITVYKMFCVVNQLAKQFRRFRR